MLAYVKCDPDLSDREYAAIDAHVESCPKCAEEYRALSDEWDALAEVLYPEASLPHIDCDAMASRVITAIRENETAANPSPAGLLLNATDIHGAAHGSWEGGCPQPPGSRSPHVAPTAQADRSRPTPFRVVPHICKLDPVARQATNPFRRLRRASALAAAAMFLVAVPVMAYVGQEVWHQVRQALTSSTDAPPVTPSVPARIGQPSPATAAGPTATPPITAEPGWASPATANLFAALDKDTEHRAVQAEVEAMLPHTDAEYEAWARKEYPHVMALYDILTGKGLPHEGETLDHETIHNRFAALVPSTLPEDVRAYLFEQADRAAQSEHPLWDGRPVNIPDWAQRLYADTPEPNRPTAWRALLIYSGEIFKLDWPRSIQEPNVQPTFWGLRNAALVAERLKRPCTAFGGVVRPGMPTTISRLC